MVRNYISFIILISVVQLNFAMNLVPAAAQGVVGAVAGEAAKGVVPKNVDKKRTQEKIKDYYDPEEFKNAVVLLFKKHLSSNYGSKKVEEAIGNYTVTRELVGSNKLFGRKYRVTVTGANVERAGIMGTATNMLASETEIDLGTRMAALMFKDKVKVTEIFGDKETIRNNPNRRRISEFLSFTHITDPNSYVQCFVNRSGGVNRPFSCSFEVYETDLDKLFVSKK